MLPDYHIHTPLCKHAEGQLQDFLAAAQKLNLPEICFTDHAPNPDNYDQKHRMSIDDFAVYTKSVHSLQSSSAPLVLIGVEADYYQGCERFLRKWLPRQNLDIVIGSVHYIGHWGFDNPDERQVWDNVDIAGTWRTYFELIGKLADTHLFDVIGHFDLPKKFGHSPGNDAIKEMVQPVLDKIARAQMAIEINSSGLRRPVKEIYPSIMLLELARARGIPICFGSDAHNPNEVGFEFAAALEWARMAGYSEAVRFSGRHKVPYSLPCKSQINTNK